MERELEHTTMDITRGSDNVFADLGLPNPEERLLKAQLALRIQDMLEHKDWTQGQVADALGLDQADVSRLLRGRLAGFSVDRLLNLITRLGHNVEVRISEEEVAPEAAHLSVRMV
jgi:predicted XRE-type DNA-binding protein